VVGGHLIEAYVRPTPEVILMQPPSYLRKRKDPETGLALIDIAGAVVTGVVARPVRDKIRLAELRQDEGVGQWRKRVEPGC